MVFASIVMMLVISSSMVQGWWCSQSLPSRFSLLAPLFAMEMKELIVRRQDRTESYEQLLIELLPSNSTVVRWYISRLDDDHAVIEAVVREQSSHPNK